MADRRTTPLGGRPPWPMPRYRMVAVVLVLVGGGLELYGLGATFPSRQIAWIVAFAGLAIQVAGISVSVRYRRR